MSSELRVRKIWPRTYTTSYIELADGEVQVFPKLAVDSIVSLTGNLTIEGWDSSTYVTTTRNQTITGIKTFTSIPVLPASDPTSDNQAVRKKYIDDLALGGMTAVPVGCLLPFAGDSNNVPAGYFLCDGGSRATTTFAALFAVLGYKYGGSAQTFYLPDLRTRIPVGYDTTQTEFNTVGKVGGNKVHVLSVSEVPSHSHTGGSASGAAIVAGASPSTIGLYVAVSNTGATGGSGAHNNLQPYVTMNYIIKY